jgi:hypothetical protein
MEIEIQNDSDNGQKDLFETLAKEIQKNGGEWTEDPNCKGSHGMTMFDMPNSEDN